MYRTRFELIRENLRSKIKITDWPSSYSGKQSRSKFLSRVEGIGPRSQRVSGGSLICLETSAKVAGRNISKRRGM
jgi:hypothetical protein